MSTPLGYRINNPGNIRWRSENHWRGQVANIEGFVEFATRQNGIRAHVLLAHNLIIDHGANSLSKLITLWAPPTDGNDTDAYIRTVASITGITDYDTPIQGRLLADVCHAMAIVEIGADFAPILSLYVEAWKDLGL